MVVDFHGRRISTNSTRMEDGKGAGCTALALVERVCNTPVENRMHSLASRDTLRAGLHSWRSFLILGWLCALVLAHSATAETAETRELRKPPATPSAAARIAVTNNPWGRIVMVGASVSAGFIASEPLGGANTPRYRLSRYVDAALLVPHEPVQNLANAL